MLAKIISLALVPFLAVFAVTRTQSSQAPDEPPVAARGPLVVAHRGASGYLPELTLAAFTLAHAQGADLIETDVLLTRDGHLVNLHDLTLDRVTNVEEVYPDRAGPDGKFHAIDFTLAELQVLRVDGPADRFEGKRVPSGLRISTLDELVELVRHLNAQTGREVGLLVEVKNPAFHARRGSPIDAPLLEALARHGYDAPGENVIIQSFDAAYLRRLREMGTRLPLVWLFDEKEPERIDLAEVARWADGIGPNRKRLEAAPALAGEAKRLGMSVFCWTFKNEPAAIERLARDHGLDGVITDFPDVAREALRAPAAP